jgi:hypothetical protein
VVVRTSPLVGAYAGSASRAGFVARGAIAVGAVALGALAVGTLVASKPLAATAIATAAFLVVVLPRSRWALDREARSYRWLPVAWLIVFLASSIKLSAARSPLDAASGVFSIDNVIELLCYGFVAAVTIAALYRLERSPRPLLIGSLVAWPVVALISTAWSIVPAFTFVRSLQLFVPILLAAYSIRVWRADPETGVVLWRSTLRLFVQALTLLTLLGFAFRGQWEVGGYPVTVKRFMWPGAQHAVLASGMVGFALVILLVGGRALTGFTRVSFFARVGLFSAALYFGHTRSVWLGVAAAALVALWVAGRDRPMARYLGFPVLATGVFFVVTLFRQPLAAYIGRGQTAYALSTLSGRLTVWKLAINAVSSGHRWLLGYGFGSARVILFQQISWAGEAHNTWLELLLGMGLVGTITALVGVVVFGVYLFRTRTTFISGYCVATALFVYLLVLSEADYYLATPGFAFTALAFLYWFVMGEKRARLQASPVGRATASPIQPKVPVGA